MPMPFLTARWERLILANYPVAPSVLEPFRPRGTTIDRHHGVAYVSLVAFLFLDTRVLGVPVPGHRNFEEVNLRFYVTPNHAPEQRAVTFLREIVPRSVIPWVANSLFAENYVAMPMSHSIAGSEFAIGWTVPKRASYLREDQTPRYPSARVAVTVDAPLSLPAPGSAAEFITEHYWGYAKSPLGTLEYRVRHPTWRSCELTQYHIKVDFEQHYGQAFAFLNDMQPEHVLYAEGSPVSVSFPSLKRWRDRTG
jgi:uncharacterized protein YqjF (DUF2071 family)